MKKNEHLNKQNKSHFATYCIRLFPIAFVIFIILWYKYDLYTYIPKFVSNTLIYSAYAVSAISALLSLKKYDPKYFIGFIGGFMALIILKILLLGSFWSNLLYTWFMLIVVALFITIPYIISFENIENKKIHYTMLVLMVIMLLAFIPILL